MSRPLCLEFAQAQALYHVTSRGDRRESIYVDDLDRTVWLVVLSQVCARFNWRCHAWCLMGNHFHVLIETPEPNLSAGMRQLNGVYTQRFKRRHGKVGHVFQGRFKAILVEREGYLLEVSRSVRAGIVRDVAEWPWSSYPAMARMEPAPPWLETDWLLAHFGQRRSSAVAKYIDFVRAGVGLPAVWESLRGQLFLGSDSFVKRMQKLIDSGPPLRDVPQLQRRPASRRIRPRAVPPWRVRTPAAAVQCKKSPSSVRCMFPP
jgi:putative transposase